MTKPIFTQKMIDENPDIFAIARDAFAAGWNSKREWDLDSEFSDWFIEETTHEEIK